MPGDQNGNGTTGKVRRWTTIITMVAGTISGITLLSVETCQAIRKAQRAAAKVEKRAAGGYEALAPAIQELQTLVSGLNSSLAVASADRAQLRDQLHSMELELAMHRAYFDFLKQRYRQLEDMPEPAVVLRDEEPESHPTAFPAPMAPVPDTLNQAQQLREH